MEMYFIHLGILVCIYIMLALGFNLVVGYTGLLHFGFIGVFGVGAYTAALSARILHLPFALGVLAAMLVGVLVSCLLALPARRIFGDYFALATLGFHFVALAVFLNWDSLTRGSLGLPGIPRPAGFAENPKFFVLALLLTVLVYVVLRRLVRSPFGHALEAVRDDEEVAAALGKPIFKLKLVAMVLSGAIAGLAGALLAHYIQFIAPSSFGIDILLWSVAAVILGGLASMEGAVIGMTLLFVLSEPLRFLNLPLDLIGSLRTIIFMGLLIIILLVKPKGLMGRAQLEN